MSKTRLDMLIMERGLAGSRQKAQAMIMEGRVYVNGQKESKSGAAFAPDALIEIRGEDLRYVSRGGLKLEKAVDVFGLDLNGLVCMDVGASTGGFTDCMLQNGAARVYAVDVGYGQFSWKLRQDSRVVVMEKTNVRYLEPKQIPEPVGFAGCDVSFISLTKIIPAVWNVLSEGALMVCLIKPQFEAGREKVGKKGVVRDPAVHIEVIENIIAYCQEHGFAAEGLSYSPIRGPEGNIEFLLLIRKQSSDQAAGPAGSLPDASAVVKEAHGHFTVQV